LLLGCEFISKERNYCKVLTYEKGQLANETTHRSGRKLNYPKCRLHHKSVITWANGSLTAPVPDYDNSERTAKADKAKAQAGGSHMARGRRRAQKKPKHNLDLGSEEDAEGESDPEYEPKILDFIVLRAFEL
jgi:hypothetical protein